MGKLVHEPFDKLVKATLHNIERAKEFLEAHLSQKAKKYINLEKGIELVNKEFIKKEYRTLRCDIVYQVNINNKKGYIYCQVEAQSKPEKLLPLRILNYNLELITWHWENKKQEIPPIANLILYNGKESPYPYEINFLELLNQYKVAKELLIEGTTLIDLSIHEDKEIEKHKKTALMELLLKHSRQRDFYNYLEKLKKSGKFKVLLNYYDERYVEGILIFVTDMLNSKNHPIEKVTELFSGIS
ncbi:MAG: Rpn family recombination-promoting nuclease/putative transposase, partial [Bacteroidetes bacterium]|nr:Rpn family recombination-promoting nuclease/putative transposase [Bacteroidota bacterium]